MSTEQNGQSREDLFMDAGRAAKKRRQERGTGGGNYGKDFEEETFLGLEYDKPKIVRLLGKPLDYKPRDPFSCREVNLSWIKGDNDKRFRCVWPRKEEQPNWILWKIFDKVMAYTWDKTLKNGHGDRVYHNIDKFPEIFARVDRNDDEGTGKFKDSGWKPVKEIVWNCIDRQDMEWHHANKKTKLLSRKADVNDEGKQAFARPGVPIDLYNLIWDDVVEFYFDWENYDVMLNKIPGKEPTDVTYKAIATQEINKVPESLRKLVKEGTLTEEEKSWERVNIDKHYGITSYQKIFNRLKVYIQSVDLAFGTKFYAELEKLVEEEKKTWTEKNSNESSETDTDAPQQAKVEAKPTLAVNTPPADNAPVRARKVPTVVEDYSAYIGYEKLTDAEKKAITGKGSNGSLLYTKDFGEPIPCYGKGCNFEAPEMFSHCPSCGIKF
jgi:hypothetical protein